MYAKHTRGGRVVPINTTRDIHDRANAVHLTFVWAWRDLHPLCPALAISGSAPQVSAWLVCTTLFLHRAWSGLTQSFV